MRSNAALHYGGCALRNWKPWWKGAVYFAAITLGVTAAEAAKSGTFSTSSAMWQAAMAGALLAAILLAILPERLFASGVAPRTGREPSHVRRLELFASFLAGCSMVLLFVSSSWVFVTVPGFVLSLLLSRHLRNLAAMAG